MTPPRGLPINLWSKDDLIARIDELESDVSRKDATISDLLGRKSNTMRVVAVPKRKKGEVDAIGRARVREHLIDTIKGNLLSMAMVLPTAYYADQLNPFNFIQGVFTAVFQPLMKYYQKKSEVD